jgi:hypothetical protein
MAVWTGVCQDLERLFDLYRLALQDLNKTRAEFPEHSTQVRLLTRYVGQLEAALSRHKQEHGCSVVRVE